MIATNIMGTHLLERQLIERARPGLNHRRHKRQRDRSRRPAEHPTRRLRARATAILPGDGNELHALLQVPMRSRRRASIHLRA